MQHCRLLTKLCIYSYCGDISRDPIFEELKFRTVNNNSGCRGEGGGGGENF
jgi:hypothetical protein